MAATALPAMLDALVAALQLRAGLTGVRVFSAPVAPESLGMEAIELADETDIEQSAAAMGSSDIEELLAVKGSIICFSPMPGSGPVDSINLAAKECRDRACAILEEVTDELASDDTIGGSVRSAAISSVTVAQGLAPEGQLGRWCRVAFTVSAEAHTTP